MVYRWRHQLALPGVLSVLLLVACVAEPSDDTSVDAAEIDSPAEVADSAGDDIIVDENLLSVEITLPKDFFDEMTDEDIQEYGSEQGYSSTTVNPDESVTVKMSRGVHSRILTEMRVGLEEYIDEVISEVPRDFTQITFDENVTRFAVEVNKSVWPSTFEAGFISWGLGISGYYYQAFAGVAESDREVVIDFIDASTGEVFDTQVWPGEE